MTCSTCALRLDTRAGGFVVLLSGETLCMGCYYARWQR